MKSKIIINKNYTIGKIDNRIYGSFIEQIGRAIYGGIYEPEHETADNCGFRQDVINVVKNLKVPIVRYPGGNFVSGYNWEDGIGDKNKRPKRPDCSWRTVEPNLVGIDEFQEWAKRVGSEIMMAVNLGTRGISDAQNLLEYCNIDSDTYYANLRKENGFKEPFKIKTWCLGNEMDAPWQIGRKTAEEYGRLAAETANVMKMADPDIELIACGSSGFTMPTFGDWELTVLDHVYDNVDYLSLHQYYEKKTDSTSDYIAKCENMNDYIKSVSAMCDSIKAKKQSDKTMYLSFDEWNIWNYKDYEAEKEWSTAPHLLEEQYTFEDALLVGGMMMVLQNNCDRVKIACLAQLINVIAPIQTVDCGKVWLQTIFYPYYYGSVYGRGIAMQPVVNCEQYEINTSITCDVYEKIVNRKVPYIATSVIYNEEKNEVVLYAINRSLEEDMSLHVEFEDFGECTPIEHIQLYSDDMMAKNSAENENVIPEKLQVNDSKSSEHIINLKKHSWNMIVFKF